MKINILIIFLFIFVLTGIPVISEELEESQPPAEPPEWSDFCESGYENAVYKKNNDVFNIFSFVKSERVKKNYWAQRREDFNKYLKNCDTLNGDAKYACYDELKKSEEQKNDLYKIKRQQILYENNVNIHRK